MPNDRRAAVKGGTYFFTAATFQRRPLLTTDRVRAALRDAIQQVRATSPFTVEAWVLLPDHLHCIWTLPPDDTDFSRRWGMIKRLVSGCCAGDLASSVATTPSRVHRREAAFWQRRYWEHLIRDEDDFHRHVDYIHWNPVKHGLVQRAAQWPYSTFHRFVSDGVYAADWGIADSDHGNFGE
jgi:REP-associated tyrosine transposase